MKKIFFSLILFLTAVFLFAAPPADSVSSDFPPLSDFPVPPDFPSPPPGPRKPGKHKNFHGKRFIDENRDFKVVIIRTFDISDMILMEVLFNGPVDSESIHSDCIKVNHTPVDFNQLRFSKNRSSFRFILSKAVLNEDKDSFLFEMEKIKSINGNEMPSVELKNCTLSSEYRFSEREKVWKRF